VNARGAIARFDRGSIEIRVLDLQECPAADLALSAAIVGAIEALALESLGPWSAFRDWPQPDLVDILHGTIREADELVIENQAYLRVLGWDRGTGCSARALWRHIVDRTMSLSSDSAEWAEALDIVLGKGSLARRIARSLGDRPSRDRIAQVYRELSNCLADGRIFSGMS
jgi:hypothetical protein